MRVLVFRGGLLGVFSVCFLFYDFRVIVCIVILFYEIFIFARRGLVFRLSL